MCKPSFLLSFIIYHYIIVSCHFVSTLNKLYIYLSIYLSIYIVQMSDKKYADLAAKYGRLQDENEILKLELTSRSVRERERGSCCDDVMLYKNRFYTIR